MKHLYKNFLQDKRVYNLNEAFYRRMVKAVTGADAAPFFQPTYVNGQKIYDDHIFSTRHEGRILQVIQREPGSEFPVLRARFQPWDGQYDMLVLTLELSDAVKPILQKIIRAWLLDKEPFGTIRAMLPPKPSAPYQTAGPALGVNDDGE